MNIKFSVQIREWDGWTKEKKLMFQCIPSFAEEIKTIVVEV